MRRKVFVILLFFLLTIFQKSECSIIKFYPQNIADIKRGSVGIVSVPKKFSVYENKSLASRVISKVDIDELLNSTYLSVKNSLYDILAFSFENQFFLYLADETSDGWFEVYINNRSNRTGWIKLKSCRYFTWKSFLESYGKDNGLFLLKGRKKHKNRLYSANNVNSQVLSSFDYLKRIELKIIKGNWMLVKIYDINNESKIGWLNWRDEDNGEIFVFPIVK